MKSVSSSMLLLAMLSLLPSCGMFGSAGRLLNSVFQMPGRVVNGVSENAPTVIQYGPADPEAKLREQLRKTQPPRPAAEVAQASH